MSGMRAALDAFKSGFRRSSSSPSLSTDTHGIDKRELILQPGKQISDKDLDGIYSIHTDVAPLGVSSSGTVYRGVDISSGDPCALRVTPRTLFVSNPSLIASLRTEASIASSFGIQPHSNVCMPISVRETRTRVVVEMDLLPGGDLQAMLSDCLGGINNGIKWLDDSHPTRIILQILRGVEYLHNESIIHCDIKPENVLLTRKPVYGDADDRSDGSSRNSSRNNKNNKNNKNNTNNYAVTAPGCLYKIADYGSSVSIPSGATSICMRAVGGVTGASTNSSNSGSSYNYNYSHVKITPGYTAPEVIRDGIVSRASDMWSVGVVIFVTLTGEMPFDVNDDFMSETFYNNPKLCLKSHPRWKKIHRLWRRTITELLVSDPEERPTAGAVLMKECFPGREELSIQE
jgi:serine/threonine protein kinase